MGLVAEKLPVSITLGLWTTLIAYMVSVSYTHLDVYKRQPYVLDSMKPGQQIIYKRNPDYWGEKHPLQVGQNNFDRIRIEYFGDDTAALEAFKSGVYTFRNENSSKNWATAYDLSLIHI